MRKFLTPLVLGAGLLFTGNLLAQDAKTPAFLTGDLAQKFELLDEPVDLPLETSLAGLVDKDGNPLDLESLKGKVLAVNFWAIWCAPCKHEMPTLNEASRKWSKDGLHVMAVSVDSKSAKGLGYLQKQKLDDLNFAYDASMKTMRKLGGQGLPLTILYNVKGQEVGRLAGTTDWADEESGKLFGHFLQNATNFN